MKNSVIGLLALSTISFISAPAFADEANIQSAEQVSTQIGDRNTSTQRSNQTKRSDSRGRTENLGSAQDSYQDSFQEGNDSESEQAIDQRNTSRRSRR